MSHPVARPAQRYGELRPAWHSTLARVLVATIAVLGVGWVSWAGWQSGHRPVTWNDVGYDVIDDATAEVTFDVTVHGGEHATCRVQALGSDFSVVGQRSVELSSEQGRTTRHQATIATQQRAVTAIVKECRLD